MIDILVSEPFGNLIDTKILEVTARNAIRSLAPGRDVDICISIDDDAVLAELNQKYLGISSPTDVLSFELNENNPETGNFYLGDILISYDRAKEQAQKAGHTTESEIRLLLIHGILHLLGYDHVDETQKKAMWEKQDLLIKKMDIRVKRLPED